MNFDRLMIRIRLTFNPWFFVNIIFLQVVHTTDKFVMSTRRLESEGFLSQVVEFATVWISNQSTLPSGLCQSRYLPRECARCLQSAVRSGRSQPPRSKSRTWALSPESRRRARCFCSGTPWPQGAAIPPTSTSRIVRRSGIWTRRAVIRPWNWAGSCVKPPLESSSRESVPKIALTSGSSGKTDGVMNFGERFVWLSGNFQNESPHLQIFIKVFENSQQTFTILL